MNPWHFLKRQLQRGNNKDNGERSVTRLVEVASSLLQGGDYVKAQTVLLRVLNSQSEIHEPIFLEWILTSLARTWEETEDYRRWTEFFTDFIGQNPNSAIAYHLRAESHWYAGSLREALADYTQSIELNPNDAGAFFGAWAGPHGMSRFCACSRRPRLCDGPHGTMSPTLILLGRPILKRLQQTDAAPRMPDSGTWAAPCKSSRSPSPFALRMRGCTSIALKLIKIKLTERMRS
jgi:tetratricopeptide (TPR) repeat protein